MKISFEGSMEEFQVVFSGLALFSADEDDEDDSPLPNNARAFPVMKGGKVVEPPAEPAPAPLPEADGVGVNPLANDMPVPENDPGVGKGLDLPKLGEEERHLGWEKFKEVCLLWIQNFGATEEVEVEEMTPLRNEQGALVNEEGRVLGRGDKAIQVPTKVTKTIPAPQPDRVTALTSMGEGRFPRAVLVMAYEIGSLQRMVEKALEEAQVTPTAPTQDDVWIEYIDSIAMNMVQVSHKAFPDLAGTYDYSERWKRVFPNSA